MIKRMLIALGMLLLIACALYKDNDEAAAFIRERL